MTGEQRKTLTWLADEDCREHRLNKKDQAAIRAALADNIQLRAALAPVAKSLAFRTHLNPIVAPRLTKSEAAAVLAAAAPSREAEE